MGFENQIYSPIQKPEIPGDPRDNEDLQKKLREEAEKFTIKEKLKEVIGDDFTIERYSVTPVSSEAEDYDKHATINVTDKDGNKRLFFAYHKLEENGEWKWSVQEIFEKSGNGMMEKNK